MSSSLNAIGNAAASGLASIQAGIGVVSDNIANAGVVGYTAKTQDLSTFEVGSKSFGVRVGGISRTVDAAVQASTWAANSHVAALTVQSNVLQSVNATQGTPGDGTSIADRIAALQAGFTQLQTQPSSSVQQSTVVAAAQTLASTINGTASTITTERNNVQSQIVTSVATLNSSLATVNATTKSLMSALASHGATADLKDQRDEALRALSSTLTLHFNEQADGNITILGENGLSIPLDSTFSTQSIVLSPASTSAGGGGSIPPILLHSSNPTDAPIDITNKISGGQLGALVQLRDTTLPSYTSSLDSLSANIATQFSNQGLELFTGAGGTAITGVSVGLSSQIQVNPAVTTTVSLVRDGTAGTANTAGTSGFTGVIDNVLASTFAGSGTTASLFSQGEDFVSKQSADTERAASDLSNATAYQTTVTSALSGGSGVNVDQQMGLMIQLQNSYQANAQVMRTTDTLFSALLSIFVPGG